METPRTPLPDGFDSPAKEEARARARLERDRQRLRDMLIEGRDSEVAGFFDKAYFDGLRGRLDRRADS